MFKSAKKKPQLKRNAPGTRTGPKIDDPSTPQKLGLMHRDLISKRFLKMADLLSNTFDGNGMIKDRICQKVSLMFLAQITSTLETLILVKCMSGSRRQVLHGMTRIFVQEVIKKKLMSGEFSKLRNWRVNGRSR